MSQMPVKWTAESFLKEQRTTLHRIPVVPLSALREVVEGLKYIEAVLCERKLCGHFTAEEIRQEAQRLLASLGEVGK